MVADLEFIMARKDESFEINQNESEIIIEKIVEELARVYENANYTT